MSTKSGHEIVPVTGKDDENQRRDFKAYTDIGTFKLQPNGWFFTNTFKKFIDKVYDFEFKPNDVVIMTYPKCGTTWVQEIIWTMRNNPDLKNPLAAMPVNLRCPFLEFDFIIMNPHCAPENAEEDPMMQMFAQKYPGVDPSEGIFLHIANTLPEPRSIKTHLPFSMLSKKLLDTAKVIYVARNPKDVCVSFYHHSRLFKAHDYKGTFDQFFDYFLSDQLVYSPYWKHVEEGWNAKQHKNLHFAFYEDLKADPKKEIGRLNEFIGTGLSEDQIKNVIDHTSFSAMKARDMVVPAETSNLKENNVFNTDVVKKDGGFFRKGEAGTWQGKFSAKQEQRMNTWIKENTKNMPIEFKYK